MISSPAATGWHPGLARFHVRQFRLSHRRFRFSGRCHRRGVAFSRAHPHHPALAVLCGGSEVRQQAEMSGVAWPAEERLFSGLLAGIAAAERPDVLYVPNSPWGGEPCFVADRGITHYYGVGAYLRRSRMRAGPACGLPRMSCPCPFAGRSRSSGGARPPAARCRLETRHPRDRGASWDFDDVRDHYVATLYGADPARLRYQDPRAISILPRGVVRFGRGAVCRMAPPRQRVRRRSGLAVA